MQAQMTRKLEWLEIDGPYGTEWVALEDLNPHRGAVNENVRRMINTVKMYEKTSGHEKGTRLLVKNFGLEDFFENREIWTADIVKGYGVRSSAPGYMDATSWMVYTSLEDAKRAYAEEKRAVRGEDY